MRENLIKIISILIILSAVFIIDTKSAKAVAIDITQPVNINGYSVNIPAILEEGSSLWSLLGEFTRPDSDHTACVNTTKTFVANNQAEMEVLFPWFWDAQDDLDEGANMFCDILQSIPGLTQTEMTNAQLFEAGSATLNIFDNETAPDWHNINGLVLDHPLGTIEFTGTIDLLSHDFVFLLLSFAEAFSMEQSFVSFDSDLINGLKSMGAIITMKNVPSFENPVILVDGKLNQDIISALVYDEVAKTITFNTAHFTSFRAVELSSIPVIEEDEGGNACYKKYKKKYTSKSYKQDYQKVKELKKKEYNVYFKMKGIYLDYKVAGDDARDILEQSDPGTYQMYKEYRRYKKYKQYKKCKKDSFGN